MELWGGKLVSGFKQGEISAQMALRVMNGTIISNIPIVRKSPNLFMFDYLQLERFGINPNELPENSIIINEPISLYKQYTYLFWSIVIIITILTVLVFSLAANIRKKIKLEKELLIHKKQLEGLVNQRTAELADVNETLRYNEALLKDAQKLAKLGHYIFNIQTDSWQSSPELNEIFGIDENYETNLASWFKIVHPDHREAMQNYLQNEIITKQTKFDKNYKIIDFKTKEEKWVHGLGELKNDETGNPIKMLGTIQDITEQVKLEEEREKLIRELRETIEDVKILSGLLPICAKCKKIRDDQGYWNNLEAYIERHSDAFFSHGMCEECSDEMYGDQDWYIDMKKNKGYE